MPIPPWSIHFFAEGYIPFFADKNCERKPMSFRWREEHHPFGFIPRFGYVFMSPESKTHQSQAGRILALSSTSDDPFLFRNPSKQTRKGCIFLVHNQLLLFWCECIMIFPQNNLRIILDFLLFCEFECDMYRLFIALLFWGLPPNNQT